MPRFKVKFDLFTKGKVVIPAASIEDAEDYVINHMQFDYLISECEPPKIEIDYVDELGPGEE